MTRPIRKKTSATKRTSRADAPNAKKARASGRGPARRATAEQDGKPLPPRPRAPKRDASERGPARRATSDRVERARPARSRAPEGSAFGRGPAREAPRNTERDAVAREAPKARRTSPEKKGDLRRARALAPKSPEKHAAAEQARTLSGKSRRFLRSLGQHLDPIVQIGKEGISEGVVRATRAALLAHELVKVKVLTEAPIDRKLAGEELAQRAGASLAQTLGRTFLLYKRHPHKPKITLPR